LRVRSRFHREAIGAAEDAMASRHSFWAQAVEQPLRQRREANGRPGEKILFERRAQPVARTGETAGVGNRGVVRLEIGISEWPALEFFVAEWKQPAAPEIRQAAKAVALPQQPGCLLVVATERCTEMAARRRKSVSEIAP